MGANPQPGSGTAARPRRARGVVGLAGVALLGCSAVSVVGAAGWTAWMVRVDAASRDGERVRALSAGVAEGLGGALAREDAAATQRLLDRLTRDPAVASARVALAGGVVLADCDAGGRLGTVPPAGAPAWAGAAPAPEGVAATPIRVEGRGTAMLEVALRPRGGGVMGWQAWAGLGVVGGLGLASAGAAWWRLRSRLRALAAVGEALGAYAGGEGRTDALAVGAAMGPEAAPWNALLAERDRLRGELLSDQVREALARRVGGGGQLAQACDSLWHGLVALDERRAVAYANPAAAAFMGVRREELASGAVLPGLLKDEPVASLIEGVFAGRLRRRAAVDVRRGGGGGGAAGGGVGGSGVVLRVSVRPVGRDEVVGALVCVEDVTQQRVAEESRHSFVAQATHELRTPLTNIRLHVEDAIESGEGDAAARSRALNVINQESLRLERIVEDMLNVSEMEAGSMRVRTDDVRVEQLLGDLQMEFAPQAEAAGLSLSFTLPPKLPVIAGDRDKLSLALHNLIGNAIKYTPRGGRVEVRVEAPADRLSVEVVDTGPGIAAEEQERVFEKFYRTAGARTAGITGTGLGLPLAREVARLHGGDVTVRSEVGKGSVFTLSVPVAAPGGGALGLAA